MIKLFYALQNHIVIKIISLHKNYIKMGKDYIY